MHEIELTQGQEYEVKVLELKEYGMFEIKQHFWNPRLHNVDGSVQTMQWKGSHFEFNDGKDDWCIHINEVRVLGVKSNNPSDVMFYSYEERKKMRSVLIRGMKNLAMNVEQDYYHSGKHRYVCLACSRRKIKKSYGMKSVNNIRKFIASRIQHTHTIENWLRDQSINWISVPFEDLQDYRKRWMQSMIAELEATL